MDEYIDLRQQSFTFIGSGSNLSGNFAFRGNTNIAGNLDGEIEMIDNAKLIINFLGTMRGKIKGHHIEIHGNFEGNIEATGHVKALPTAKIDGNIKAKDLIIYPGAKINIEGSTEQGPANEAEASL